MDIADFLQARLEEDEQAARAAVGEAVFAAQTGRWRFEPDSIPVVFAVAADGAKTQAANMEAAWEARERGTHIARHDPARVLAEVESKRVVIASYKAARDSPERWTAASSHVQHVVMKRVVRVLAAAYADHPDYDRGGEEDEWDR